MTLDAVVVGSGPNGLAAAVALAQAGRSVTVLEGADTIGGGTRTAELTVPGLMHDVCSAVHPFGVASPFLASLPLAEHGLVWRHPEVDLAHPLDDGTAGVMVRSLDETCAGLGVDGSAWRGVFGPLTARLRRPGRRRARAGAAVAGPPGPDGAVRAPRRAAGDRPGREVPDSAGQGPVRRLGGARLPAAQPAAHARRSG